MNSNPIIFIIFIIRHLCLRITLNSWSWPFCMHQGLQILIFQTRYSISSNIKLCSSNKVNLSKIRLRGHLRVFSWWIICVDQNLFTLVRHCLLFSTKWNLSIVFNRSIRVYIFVIFLSVVFISSLLTRKFMILDWEMFGFWFFRLRKSFRQFLILIIMSEHQRFEWFLRKRKFLSFLESFLALRLRIP